jgi:hypothetical protein
VVDLSEAAIQALMFAVFAGFTAILAAIIGPTYDNLFVPEMAPAALFPPMDPGASGSFLGTATSFSTYLLVHVVDPLVAVVGLAVGLAYLGRSFFGRWAGQIESGVGRLVLAVVVANFTLPIAQALLDLSAATYPVIADFDGGAWQHWVNLAGWGELWFSFDNGAVAFILSFVLFSIVLLLAIVVAVRNALLAVLLVLLPLFTLLWPIPALAPLARRGWLWFGELAFLPCVLVIPLELAVGAPNILLLLGFLTVALSSPMLISVAGTQLSGLGMPSSGGVLTGGIQRGLASASSSARGWIEPMGSVSQISPVARGMATGAGRTLGGAALPAAIPLLAADAFGRGTAELTRFIRAKPDGAGASDQFRPGRGPAHSRSGRG